jgi:hypothetical protein
MKILFTYLVVFFCQLSHAQSLYHVTSETSLNLNGEEFIQYDLAPLKEEIVCESKTDARIDQGLLAANAVATLLAGYGVFKSQNDKNQHAFAGFVMGNVTTGMLQLILPKNMKRRKAVAIAGGIGSAVIVGIAKEVLDSKGYGHVETMDAVVTGLGGVGGSLTIGFGDISKAFRRNR